MKKLKLMALNLGANEVLTRAQLQNVLGGSAPPPTSGGGYCEVTCTCGTNGQTKSGAVLCGQDQTCSTDSGGAYCSGGGYLDCEEICDQPAD